jgi:hypothetical protein
MAGPFGVPMSVAPLEQAPDATVLRRAAGDALTPEQDPCSITRTTTLFGTSTTIGTHLVNQMIIFKV